MLTKQPNNSLRTPLAKNAMPVNATVGSGTPMARGGKVKKVDKKVMKPKMAKGGKVKKGKC